MIFLGITATALGLLFAAPVPAQEEIRIGLLYPTSGPAAKSGTETLEAIKLAYDIVNGSFDIPLPYAKTAGLPGRGGAKIRLIIEDHGGRPERGRSASPASPSQENRFRHFSTVFGATPSFSAVTTFCLPSAAINTIRARSATRCSVQGLRTRASSSSRSVLLNWMRNGLVLPTGGLRGSRRDPRQLSTYTHVLLRHSTKPKPRGRRPVPQGPA